MRGVNPRPGIFEKKERKRSDYIYGNNRYETEIDARLAASLEYLEIKFQYESGVFYAPGLNINIVSDDSVYIAHKHLIEKDGDKFANGRKWLFLQAGFKAFNFMTNYVFAPALLEASGNAVMYYQVLMMPDKEYGLKMIKSSIQENNAINFLNEMHSIGETGHCLGKFYEKLSMTDELGNYYEMNVSCFNRLAQAFENAKQAGKHAIVYHEGKVVKDA